MKDRLRCRSDCRFHWRARTSSAVQIPIRGQEAQWAHHINTAARDRARSLGAGRELDKSRRRQSRQMDVLRHGPLAHLDGQIRNQTVITDHAPRLARWQCARRQAEQCKNGKREADELFHNGMEALNSLPRIDQNDATRGTHHNDWISVSLSRFLRDQIHIFFGNGWND